MERLIARYRKLPSPANRAALQRYIDKHAMAVCMLLPSDTAFLNAHGFSI